MSAVTAGADDRLAGDSVVTVTANPAIDHTLDVPGFAVNTVNRVARDQRNAGGKGVNVAAFLCGYGVQTTVTGFLGRPNAGLFEQFFHDTGIVDDFVRVDEPTRTGIKIVNGRTPGDQETTDINFPGFSVTTADLAALEVKISELARPDRWVVLAGSLPPGAPPATWARLTGLAKARGALVAVDTSGPALREALAAGPDLVKPNRAELEEYTGRRLGTQAELLDAARSLGGGGVTTVVVSLGADGALFVRADDAVLAVPPAVTVASTVGAGDAMMAGSVAGTLCHLSLYEVATLATGFSMVALARIGPGLDAGAVAEAARAVSITKL